MLVLARRLAAERGWAWVRAMDLQAGHVQVMCGRAMTVDRVTVLGPRLTLVHYRDALPLEWNGTTEVAVLAEGPPSSEVARAQGH